MAGWNSPIPSTEHGGDKSKLRLSAGNAGMDASLEMPHSLGMVVYSVCFYSKNICHVCAFWGPR